MFLRAKTFPVTYLRRGFEGWGEWWRDGVYLIYVILPIADYNVMMKLAKKIYVIITKTAVLFLPQRYRPA